MSTINVHDLIRIHSNTGGVTTIGKVVWIEEGKNVVGNPDLRFWWIEIPPPQKTKTGLRNRSFIKAPNVGKVEIALKREAEGDVSFVRGEYSSEYRLTDEDLLEDGSNKGLDRRSRRQLTKWKAKRDAHYNVIAPVVEKYDRKQLLEQDKAKELLAQRAAELGHEDSKKIEQIFRRFLLGGWQKNALLPAWKNSGKPGSEKIGKVPSGRKNKNGTTKYLLTEHDRQKLKIGWKKYKKQGISVHDAYLKTMHDYYVKSVEWTNQTEVKVMLLPEEQRPTQAMFEQHGPKGVPELAAHRINLGERLHARTQRGLRGSSRSGIAAVGQLGVLDATSEDQQPVSMASRLMTLPSTWRTMLVDARLNYIYGIHRGFERGGALAGLLAIENAAKDKVEWAREELGIEIEPGQLEKIVFKRVRGDAGDLKNETGIVTMTSAEISAEFTRSYAAEHKIVETGHMIMHRKADHLISGSNRGRMLGRGERTSEPCVTLYEAWSGVINAWIEHNNVTPVPELLTLEMRRANVEPTRQKILKFLREEGYVASEPYDLELLRAQCMPRLQGSIQGDGIHIFDPRVKDRRYIPGLVYWAEWMDENGLTTRARKAVISCEIRLNPTFLGTAWLDYGKLRPVHLQTQEPELRQTALADWLYISDQDALKIFLSRGTRENAAASRVVSAQALNKAALAAKRKEQSDNGKYGSKTPSATKKRINLDIERDRISQQRLGLAPPAPQTTSFTNSTPTEYPRLSAIDGTGLWDDDDLNTIATDWAAPPSKQEQNN